MRIVSTLTLLFILIPTLSFCQSSFKPGFIVRKGGDTTRGFIKQDIEEELQSKIIFRQNFNDHDDETLTVADINAFGFDDENSYAKITYTNPDDNVSHTILAKRMLGGYYQLYSFLRLDKLYFAVISGDSTYLLYDVDFNSSGVIKQQANYKNMMYFLSRSCEQMKGGLEKRLEDLSYNKTDILHFFESLNDCMKPGSESNVYYRREKSKFGFYVYAGGISFSTGHEYTGKVIARYVIPGLNDQTSLNFGFNFMQNFKTKYTEIFYQGNMRKEDVTINIYSFPITMQYIFARGTVQPYLDAGVSVVLKKGSGAYDYGNRPIIDDERKGLGITVAAGLQVKIVRDLMIGAEWRYELLMHYPTIGIAYRFGK
jgi:opacity protein-like surface antigen